MPPRLQRRLAKNCQAKCKEQRGQHAVQRQPQSGDRPRCTGSHFNRVTLSMWQPVARVKRLYRDSVCIGPVHIALVGLVEEL